jgi:hypothetical protein
MATAPKYGSDGLDLILMMAYKASWLSFIVNKMALYDL